MHASIDQLVEKLERQVTRYRTRGRSRRRKAARANGPSPDATPVIPEEPEEEIVKTKQFAVNSLSPQDAVLQLELVGHDFFVFRNDESGEVNVVYRRRDGQYGLIEPQ
jgi:putative sigma-54 modulation protein